MTVGLSNTALLDLPLPVEGYFDGTWGNLVNYALTDYLDIAIAGTLTLNGDGAVTLTNTAGDDSATNISSTTAQYAAVKITGTLTTTKVVTVGTSGSPAVSKIYVLDNAATGGTVTFKAYGQTGISVAVGERCVAYFNGTDFVKVASSVADGVTSVSGTGTVNGITLSGTVTSTGSLTLGGALTGVNLASQVTGTLPIANGGTGTTSTTFVNLASNVTGTLPVANGGTGGTTSTGSGAVVLANSPTLVTPALGTPASGNFSSGSFTWPTFNQNTTGTAAGLSSTLAVASGGTGVTTSTGTGSVVLSASPTLTGTPLAPTAANGTSTTQIATTAYVQNSISAISAGVTSFSAGTTGLTPSTGTSGAVTLGGVLGTANGGTGSSSTTFVNLTSNVTGTLPVANGGTGVTTSTGSGNNVLSTSPTLVTPVLGTPASVTLTNATGLPISTGVSGLGTGVATALAANIGAVGSAVTNGGALGTPSSATLTNATGLPLSTGITGFGTGISTALATNTGSAGAPVLFNGALGTPASGNLANCTFPTLNQNTTGTAASTPLLQTTNFSISEVGGVLVFKYGATTIATMDSSGNLTTLANVTAYGSI